MYYNDVVEDIRLPHLQVDNVRCQSYSTNFLKRNIGNIRSDHNFLIFHCNIRSLKCHYDKLSILLGLP